MWDLFSSKKIFILVSNVQISRFNLIIYNFGWDIIGWLVGLEWGCNDSNRLGLGDRKVVGILLDLFMGLEMTWIWRFLIYSAEKLVSENGYSFGKQLLKYPSKNPSVIELTLLVSHLEHLKECSWCNTWQRTGIHTHRKLWTATRVITWATTRNFTRFLAWHSSRFKVGTPPGCWVVKFIFFPTCLQALQHSGHCFISSRLYYFALFPSFNF